MVNDNENDSEKVRTDPNSKISAKPGVDLKEEADNWGIQVIR